MKSAIKGHRQTSRENLRVFGEATGLEATTAGCSGTIVTVKFPPATWSPGSLDSCW